MHAALRYGIGIGIGIVLTAGAVVTASAQGSGGGRGGGTAGAGGRGGRATTVTAGWTGAFECVRCTVHVSPTGTWVEFGAEPVVRGQAGGSGFLLDGDVLVAVDGALITTPAGGQRLASVGGPPLRLTIRRDGRQLDMAVPMHVSWRFDTVVVRPSARPSDSTLVGRIISGTDTTYTVAGLRKPLHWQFGSFGFSGQPAFTPTQPDGRPTAGGVDSAVHAVPNPYYLDGRSDTAVDARIIRFQNIPVGGTVRIYTSEGALVRVLQNIWENGAAVSWNARNRDNQLVSSGTYFYTVESGGTTRSGRLTIADSLHGTGRGSGRGVGLGVDSLGNVVHNEMNVTTTRGWLGFALDCFRCSVDREDVNSRDGITRFTTPPRVAAVEPGGAASVAKFKVGDVIRTIDGKAMTSAPGAERFSALRAGERVQFIVERGGQLVTLTLLVPKVY